MKLVRVLLADGHALVRAGIRSLLEQVAGVEVVAEAGDGLETLALIEEHHPDVVLMNVSMPDFNGLEATVHITRDYPDVKVLMLSVHTQEEYVWQALHAGAAGYLLKDADIAELELAVKALARGESFLSPAVSRQVIERYVEYVEEPGVEQEPVPDPLTPRQQEVLQLIAEGNTTKQIAALLKVSVKTVETHRMQLMNRLDIHDIAGLVRYAIRVGIVSAKE